MTAEDEDEAAKAVRSILGHTDMEDIDKGALSRHQVPRHTFEEEANKENSEVKRSPASSRLLREKVLHEADFSTTTRGLKRPCSTAVEIQYVTSESKLDAPGSGYSYF